jgi:hypothetical protein
MDCKYFVKLGFWVTQKHKNSLQKKFLQLLDDIQFATEKAPSMLLEVLSFKQCLILKTPQFFCYEQHGGR